MGRKSGFFVTPIFLRTPGLKVVGRKSASVSCLVRKYSRFSRPTAET